MNKPNLRLSFLRVSAQQVMLGSYRRTILLRRPTAGWSSATSNANPPRSSLSGVVRNEEKARTKPSNLYTFTTAKPLLPL